MTLAPERDETSASQRIRERLLSGEPISVAQLAEEYGTSKGLANMLISRFRQAGYDVTAISKPYNGRRVRHYVVKEKPKKAEATPKPKTNTVHKFNKVAPDLGDELVVTLLALGPDGELRIGLRNGDNSMIVKLEEG